MTDPQTLLADYAAHGSEEAFRELVARYVDLVYSSAVRLTDGDTHRAEDVTQIVFADLARLGDRFSRQTMLGGWLHRRTCHVAANLLRSERRRQHRERQAAQMNAVEDHAEARMADIAPILDEAINQLSSRDREAIVLRFFEGRDLRAVGAALATSDDAAQKRIARALEKLRGLLLRRSIALSGAGLAALLGANAVGAAPAGLAATVSASALAGVAAGGGAAGLAILKLMAMTKFKITISTLAVAGIGTTVVLEHRAQARLREENRTLQQQALQLSRLAEENQRLSNLLAQVNGSAAQLSQLDRLRNEASQLRGQQQGLEAARAENRQLRSARAAGAAPALSPAERWPTALFELPKESWALAGYATPEAAVRSTLWAGLSGDPEAILNSAVPETREEAKTAADKQRMATIISGNMKRWTGLRVLEKRSPAGDQVDLTVHAQGVDAVFKMKFKRVGSEWKYAGEARAD